MPKFKGLWDVAGPIQYNEISFKNQIAKYKIIFETNLRPTDIDLFTGVEVEIGTKKTRFSCDKWLAPRRHNAIGKEYPSDFYDLVRLLATVAD